MSDAPWTIGRLLQWTTEFLGQHGAENPRLDAEVLLASARGCQRIDLYAAYSEEASDELRSAFRAFVSRRAKGEPVAYIVGHKEFYSLDFEVTPDVLIPRPETELLVVALLDQAKNRPPLPLGEGRGEGVLEIADVGTGSGILAICAAKFLPTARVTAIDINPAALAVARRNAERHGVADRITFVEADLLSAEPAEPHYDIIVSNPPYVSMKELSDLPPDVRDHEPHLALVAGPGGTDVIERLVPQAAERLRPGGALLIEVSPMIAPAVEQLVRSSGRFTVAPTLRDSANQARVIDAIRT